jgi:RimJ/RimL family protein N-acetyltransferase
MEDPHGALRTERLSLRRWTEADLDALHRIWSDPQTIFWGPSQSLDETRGILERALATTRASRPFGVWAVEHQHQIVGNVFLRYGELLNGALELGYHFHSSQWGKGYAFEAVSAVLALAPGRRVLAPILPQNARSRRLAARLGFTVVGKRVLHELEHDLWQRDGS